MTTSDPDAARHDSLAGWWRVAEFMQKKCASSNRTESGMTGPDRTVRKRPLHAGGDVRQSAAVRKAAPGCWTPWNAAMRAARPSNRAVKPVQGDGRAPCQVDRQASPRLQCRRDPALRGRRDLGREPDRQKQSPARHRLALDPALPDLARWLKPGRLRDSCGRASATQTEIHVDLADFAADDAQAPCSSIVASRRTRRSRGLSTCPGRSRDPGGTSPSRGRGLTGGARMPDGNRRPPEVRGPRRRGQHRGDPRRSKNVGHSGRLSTRNTMVFIALRDDTL